MINAIDFNSEKSTGYINDIGGDLQILPNIKRINILVGENNSGKSRLMRSLIKSDSVIYLSDYRENDESLSLIRSRLKQQFSELHSIDSEYVVNVDHDYLSPCNLYLFYRNQFSNLEIKYNENSFLRYGLKTRINNDLNSLYEMLVMYENIRPRSKKVYKRIYIPVLRGVECYKEFFEKNNNNDLKSISMNFDQRKAFDDYKQNAELIYTNKISKAYGIKENAIFTGEKLFSEIRDKLLGSERDRLFIRDFERFLSKLFFDCDDFTIIPSIKDGYLKVKVGKSEERALHDLGDGIKQIICILYKVFENRNNEAIICIEEPEINLHPGYQRKLMDILQLSEFSKIHFFITTHSNHIVDSCFDYDNISIYKFINVDKDTNNTFKVINTTSNDVDILNQLGVNNSSVFMSNCTIWVEGISDKIYLNKYLKTYISSNKGLKDYKEGVDYSFVEYGGNNIVHWSFDEAFDEEHISALGITNRAFIVVDNDNDGKQERKKKLKMLFKENFYELNVKEIENTIGNELLVKYLSNHNKDYEPGMNKSNESIESKGVEIWRYIDDNYKLKKKYSNRKGEPSVSKLTFSKDVCSLIECEDDLSKSAKRLAKKLYDFIDKVSCDING